MWNKMGQMFPNVINDISDNWYLIYQGEEGNSGAPGNVGKRVSLKKPEKSNFLLNAY